MDGQWVPADYWLPGSRHHERVRKPCGGPVQSSPSGICRAGSWCCGKLFRVLQQWCERRGLDEAYSLLSLAVFTAGDARHPDPGAARSVASGADASGHGRRRSQPPRSGTCSRRGGRDASVCCIQAEHQADVLHGCAGGALAEVVEPGDEHRVVERRLAEHVSSSLSVPLSASARAAHLQASPTTRTRLRARVVRDERPLRDPRGRACRAGVEMQRDRNQHALPEIADARHEDRPPRQPA